MSRRTFMPEPCEHCPFRQDVRPFLRPERAADLALSAQNPYSTFVCHKTLGEDEDGDSCVTGKSLDCAGFLSLQMNETGRRGPKGFEPSLLVYEDAVQMIDAYAEEDA